MLLRFACYRSVSAGAILNTSGRRTVFASEYCPPHHKITTFDILEGFQSFLRWGTLFTEGGHYSLVNNVRGDNIH